MLIREGERGAQKIYAYRTARFGAKTSAWHWGRVLAALLRILHKPLFFRHAAWAYVDDFLFFFPSSAAPLQFAIALICLRLIGAPLSWKKLQFGSLIEWNGWSINTMHVTAGLPLFKVKKIQQFISNLQQQPCRKIPRRLSASSSWATSLDHHARFLLTSLYGDLFAFPATNYSVTPTLWEHFLEILNDEATITKANKLHIPIGAKISEFRRSSITSMDQLPRDVPLERHVWVCIRDPNSDKRKLSKESKNSLFWTLQSLPPLLSIIPLNCFCSLHIQAAADAFATDNTRGMGGWVTIPTGAFWFSETWKKSELTGFITVEKDLQRYVSF